LELDISVEIIAIIVAISWIPWIFRFTWSSIIDYFGKYSRKIFVLLGGVSGAFCFFALYFIDPVEHLAIFAILQMAGHVGITFLMSASSAWAIDICNENERGKASGALKAGEAISFGLTAVIFSQIALNYGYRIIFPITAVGILIFLFLPFITNEEKIRRKREKIFKKVIIEFRNKTTQLVAIFGPIISISGGITIIAAPIFASEFLKLNVAQIGIVSATGLLIGIPASYIGGYLADKKGRKNTMYIAIFPSIILFFSLIFFDDILILLPYFIIIFLGHFVTASLLAVYMDATNKKIAATQFSLFVSIANIGYFGGSAVTGILIKNFGFDGLFITLALINIISLLYLRNIKLKS
jgi:PAT family beta-lactamase induction signal transducer AmpG